jgi:GTP pyrophosphokinase
MTLSARFGEALAYAFELHANQHRKGSDVPYVAHLLSVAALVLEHGGSEDEAIAALLHDAVEDQGGAATSQAIDQCFGPEVAAIVEGCSDATGMPKPPWRERKESFVTRLATARPAVHLVCAADKLHNARSLVDDYREQGEELWQRFSGGRTGTLWYYRAVAEALAGATCQRLVRELTRAVNELEHMASRASDDA